MGVRVQVIKGIYYLAVTHNGHRHYESLHMRRSGTKMDREMDKVAELCRAKREMQLACSDFEIPDPTGSRITLYEYMESVINRKETKKIYINCLKYIGAYPEGKTVRLKDISTEWLAGFQGFMLKSDLSRSSVNTYMLCLRTVLNQAVKDRKLVSNPARNLPTLTVPQQLFDVLTIDDIRKLDSTPVNGLLGAEAKRAFLFACWTGLRISDIKDLTWKNVEGNTIRLVMHKTSRLLEIPIHENALKYLVANDTDMVFPLVSATTTNCLHYFRRWAKKAGINKKIGWHTARRSFATIAVEAGVDQYVISKLLGHTSMKHTATYSQVPITTKRDAVGKIPSI